MPERGRPKKKNISLSTTVRFNVPNADAEVFAWIDSQYNLANSMRALIKDFVARHGYADSTCVASVAVKQPVAFANPVPQPAYNMPPQQGEIQRQTIAQPVQPIPQPAVIPQTPAYMESLPQAQAYSPQPENQDAVRALESMLK